MQPTQTTWCHRVARTGWFALLMVICAAVHATAIIAEPNADNVRAALEASAVEGVLIDAVTLSGDADMRAQVKGHVTSNTQLSAFLRWIDGSETFNSVELVSIEAVAEGGSRYELQAKVTRPPPPVAPPSSTPESPRRKAVRCMIDGREVFQSAPCPTR